MPDSFGLSIDPKGQTLILATKDFSYAGIYDLVLKAETTGKVSADLNFKLELIYSGVNEVEDTEKKTVAISIPEPSKTELSLPSVPRVPEKGKLIL